MRISRDRLWHEDCISRQFDELCPDEVAGDLFGLRRLFDMEKFPGLVEDHEEWVVIWEFFIARPLLMLFALRFYRRKPQTPKPLVRSHSFQSNFNLYQYRFIYVYLSNLSQFCNKFSSPLRVTSSFLILFLSILLNISVCMFVLFTFECERNLNLGRPRKHIGATSCGAIHHG